MNRDQTVYFTCPHCDERFARVEELRQGHPHRGDIPLLLLRHPGGLPGGDRRGLRAAAQGKKGLPLLQPRTLPVRAVNGHDRRYRERRDDMRLAAQAKGGFYPTPERVVDLLAGLIHTPTGYYHRDRETLRILDPCCGAGEALAQLAGRMDAPNAIPIETYGVELHRDRAEEAEKRLGHALASDLFATSIANGAFGLLLLNPPYDYDSEDKRTEHAFLTQTTRYLAEGGLLVFIVPRQRLAVSARYLSTHYGRTRCWAFPDPEREVFDQVVLMAYRKADPVPDAHAESMVLEWAAGEPEPMRPDPYPPFTPKTTPSGDILFTTRTVDPVAAAAEARRSGLWTSTEITDTLWPARDTRTRPLMPLQAGTHGDAGGGGLPGQPLPGGRGPAHPGQGPHLEGDGHGGGQPGEGGPPGEAQDHRGRPGPATAARLPTSQHRRLAPRAAPQGPTIPLPGNGGASLRLDGTQHAY